jgi:DNA-binding NarL/FixJ family response regulator
MYRVVSGEGVLMLAPFLSQKGGFQLIRIGIVDDHPVFRLGLRGTFERQRDIKVVWDLGDATNVLETLAAAPVDVVLMDLDLGPGPDGLTATRAVKRAHPEVRVIVLTASLDTANVSASRVAGASGYLAKDLPVADMLAAVRKLATPGAVRLVLGDHIGATPLNGHRALPGLDGLTRREEEVLAELKRGRTNREIATRLGVSVTTVNKHVQQVLKKLQVKNRGQAVARLHAVSTPRVFHGPGTYSVTGGR